MIIEVSTIKQYGTSIIVPTDMNYIALGDYESELRAEMIFQRIWEDMRSGVEYFVMPKQ